jgi:hypothetical protein
MGYPDRETAEKALDEGARLNPGPWVDHSRNVARACRYIGERCGMDADKAYVLGLLHDIGRSAGRYHMRHALDGYRYCMEKGWADAAKICMTHSYKIQDVDAEIGNRDVTPEEYAFMKEYIGSVTYDDYDKLVQLCDALALASGFCLLEKRLLDVTRRYGVSPYTVKRWDVTFELKGYFEERMGCSVYDVLPGVRENTFG